MFRTICGGAVLLIGVASLGIGCRSLDAERDISSAARLVGERSGATFAWESVPEPDAIPRASEAATPITVDEAVRRSLERHPVIRREIATVEAARADLVQSDLLPNPVIQGALGIPIDGDGGSPTMASVTTMLTALWERPARLDAATADLRAAVLTLSDVALRLIADVRTGCAAVTFGQRRMDLDQAIVRQRDEQLALWLELYEAGEATRSEVNEARLVRARAVDRLLANQATYESARRSLAERIGDVVPVDVVSVDVAPPPPSVPSEERLVALVAEQRLDVGAAFARLEGATARRRVAGWRRFPEVSVGARYERNFSDREAIFPQAQLSLPIFDTGAAARAKARAIETATRETADAILLAACREARLAYVAWTAARAQHESIVDEWLPASQENVDLAERRYEAGELGRLGFLEARIESLAAERQAVDAEFAWYRAYFELERAVGGRWWR